MIKGKTTIELTDVNTGKVERYEDENIITDAAQIYTGALTTVCCPYNSSNIPANIKMNESKRLPLWNSTFGGIKLFENTIEENVSNWHMPKVSQNKVIGYASVDASDGTDSRRGSRNTAETVAIDNGVQIVWDFGTSEANGTISCVCLTSGEGGAFPYGLGEPKITSIFNLKSPNQINGYDKTEKVLYASNTSAKTLVKHNFFLDKLPFDKEFFGLNTVETIQCVEAINKSAHLTGSNNLSYIYYAGTGSNGTTEVDIYSYSKEDGTLTKQYLYPENISVATSNYVSSNHKIFGDYLYLEKKDLAGYYKVNLSNPSDITEIILPKNESTAYHFLIELPNGDLATNAVVFDPETGVYDANPILTLFTNDSNYVIEDLNEIDGFLFYVYKYKTTSSSSGDYGVIVPNNMMLHSINNLDTPVTKTADKTMKITYTLTYTQ